jgi:hypothetical protein
VCVRFARDNDKHAPVEHLCGAGEQIRPNRVGKCDAIAAAVEQVAKDGIVLPARE